MSSHPLATAGLVLLVAGAVLYLGSIIAAVLRVGRQYSRAMPGRSSLRMSAAVAAGGKYWYFLVPVIAGGVLLAIGR